MKMAWPFKCNTGSGGSLQTEDMPDHHCPPCLNRFLTTNVANEKIWTYSVMEGSWFLWSSAFWPAGHKNRWCGTNLPPRLATFILTVSSSLYENQPRGTETGRDRSARPAEAAHRPAPYPAWPSLPRRLIFGQKASAMRCCRLTTTGTSRQKHQKRTWLSTTSPFPCRRRHSTG